MAEEKSSGWPERMKTEECSIKDAECHLDRIRAWHQGLESEVDSIVEVLQDIRRKSEQATEDCSEHYKRTVELTWAKTRFTYEVSHELKAPLASVYNILTIILDGYLEQNREKQMELLARAKVRINDIVMLLNDLLIFSHLEERTKSLEKSEIDVGNVIASLVDDMEAFAEESGVEMEWTLAEESPLMYGNSNLLRRVFENVIHNAIKYSDSGDTVNVTARKEDDTFLFVVSDEGVGIREEEISKVFDIFFRGKNARPEHKKEGMGLGLSIVKRIVDAHDGLMRFSSKLHEGTTVEIRFPTIERTEQ
jgi:signal transduction histidine kinase